MAELHTPLKKQVFSEFRLNLGPLTDPHWLNELTSELNPMPELLLATKRMLGTYYVAFSMLETLDSWVAFA